MGTLFDEDPKDHKQWRADLRGYIDECMAKGDGSRTTLPNEVIRELLLHWKPGRKPLDTNVGDAREFVRERVGRMCRKKLDEIVRRKGRTAYKPALHRLAKVGKRYIEKAYGVGETKNKFGQALFDRLAVGTVKRWIESDKPPGQKKRSAS